MVHLSLRFLYNIVKEKGMWDIGEFLNLFGVIVMTPVWNGMWNFHQILSWFGVLVTKETADFIFWGLIIFVFVGPVAVLKIGRYVYFTLKRRANKFWLAGLYKYINEHKVAINPDLEQEKVKVKK